MKYTKFIIENYRAIKGPLEIDLSSRIIPLIGINECGKTTILQAIYCFDYNNDNTYEGRHLKNTMNLYSPNRNVKPHITASIEIDRQKFFLITDHILTELKKRDNATPKPASVVAVGPDGQPIQKQQKTKYQIEIEELDKFRKEHSQHRVINLSIVRDFVGSTPQYFCDLFPSLSADMQSQFCIDIIDRLPRIIYTDDFTDRPESIININQAGQVPVSDWKNIFEKVFRLAGNYTLSDTLNEQDSRIQKTILSNVKIFLNESLTGFWSRFSSSRVIETNLDITPNKQLSVTIVERTETGAESYFEITDRSKGFIWYYNFIMKIMFNPKESGSENETIFLLDEPGSYLHDKAQEDLCSKLKDISEKEGIVIYCTHSAKLLNPKIVAPNNIQIIEKDKNSNVQATSLLSKNNTKSSKNSALQPLYEALEIPEYEKITQNEKIVCVEGIYDKYAIECFCLNLSEDIRIFPSTGAASVINNISYFITYQRPYIALWDNDSEGRKQKEKASEYFGTQEARNFTMLPLMNKDKMIMQDMFDENDFIMFKERLNLPKEANYATIINTFRFCGNVETKKEIISNLSENTKLNFETLSQMIQNHFCEFSTSTQ